MKNKIWSSLFSSFRKTENKDIKYVDEEQYDNIKKDRDKWKKLFYEKKSEFYKSERYTQHYEENYEKMKENRDAFKKEAELCYDFRNRSLKLLF